MAAITSLYIKETDDLIYGLPCAINDVRQKRVGGEEKETGGYGNHRSSPPIFFSSQRLVVLHIQARQRVTIEDITQDTRYGTKKEGIYISKRSFVK